MPRSSPLKSARASSKQPARTKTIRQKEFIPADPSDIYNAFLDAHKQTEITGAAATCERRVGGKFSAWDGYISGTNLRLENGRRIIQRWKTSEWPKGYKSSTLELAFRPKGRGTVVELVQTNVPAAQVDNYKRGWVDYYWTPLKRYFGK